MAGIGWALYEVGSAAYDVYNAVTTVADPTATAVEKGVAVVGAAVSVFGPGGGYGTLGRADANVIEALPELRISASKYPELAQNMLNAQKAGHPTVLTHNGGKGAIGANRAAALQGVPNIKPFSRDEYPFASANEGGVGAWVGHIAKRQQDAQGALIANFLEKYRIKPGDRYRVLIVE